MNVLTAELLMSINSNTKIAAPRRQKTRGDIGGFVFAVLREQDFARAKEVVQGFERWDAFDDFVSERDGGYIGLSCAGLSVYQVDVDIRDFELWTFHSRIHSSIQTLDDFAALIHAFRSHPHPFVNGVLSIDWRRAAPENRQRNGRFRLPISPMRYQQWLETLARLDILSQIPSIDVYARLLLESWAESI